MDTTTRRHTAARAYVAACRAADEARRTDTTPEGRAFFAAYDAEVAALRALRATGVYPQARDEAGVTAAVSAAERYDATTEALTAAWCRSRGRIDAAGYAESDYERRDDYAARTYETRSYSA